MSAVYVCPTHVEVRSAGPGTCPHCHMRLARERGVLKLLLRPGRAGVAVARALARWLRRWT